MTIYEPIETRSPAALPALRPYEPPASCATTPLVAGVHLTFPAHWIIGEGLRAGTPLEGLFQGGNKVQWQADRGASLPLIAAFSGPPGGQMSLENPQPIGHGIHSTSLRFDLDGCWRFRAVAGDAVVEATVYVYPFDCRPNLGVEEPPPIRRPCRPAEGP